MNEYEILIFYKYTPIVDPEATATWQRELMAKLGLTGRVLVAKEGINGTAEGTIEALAKYEKEMHAQAPSNISGQVVYADFSDLWFKHSPGTGSAFPKIKVKVRNEIVTLGLGSGDIDPTQMTGTHITPQTLKAWLEAGEELEIIDMRNDYEFKVGHFKNSINPNLENFRDLPKALPTLSPLKKKKVLTVCTYGVRCEKASGYLKSQGFEDVYQLQGGIGTYMKEYPGEDFNGSLFVFDNRMLERTSDHYTVVGECEECTTKSEHYTNCADPSCHKKMIVCEECIKQIGATYCSAPCQRRTLLA